MTSRLTLGGNEQSAGSHYGRDTQPDLKFHTYASAAYDELAAPNALAGDRAFQSVARVRSQEDRALFPAIRASFEDSELPHPLANVLTIMGVSLLFLITALAIAGAGFICLFVRTSQSGLYS